MRKQKECKSQLLKKSYQLFLSDSDNIVDKKFYMNQSSRFIVTEVLFDRNFSYLLINLPSITDRLSNYGEVA